MKIQQSYRKIRMGSVTTCIDTVLGDLKLLYNPKDSRTSGPLPRVRVPDSLGIRFLETRIWILMGRLRNLRTFILCVRRLGNDMHLRTDGNNSNKEGSLGSQLVRSEEAVCRNAQEIHLNASGNDMHLRTDGNNSNKEGSLGSQLVRSEEAVCRNAQEIPLYASGNDMHLRTDGNNSNKEGSLGSQLARSEEAVCRNAQEIHLNASQNCIPILMHRLWNLIKFFLCMRRSGNDMHQRTDGNNSNKEGSLGSLLTDGYNSNKERSLGSLLTDGNNSNKEGSLGSLLTDGNNSNKEGSLGFLLVRIEEAVCRNAQDCLSFEAGLARDRKITQFIDDINSFEKEIEEWYINLTDFLQQSVSPTTDQVMEIINSVLENLVDLLSYFGRFERASVMESLAAMMKFMKNFVRFATLRRVESQQLLDLLKAIEAFAVNAAQLSFKYQYEGYANEIIQSETSVLLRKIKPIDPHIYETYTRALTSSKLSRQLHASISDMDDDPIIIIKDFHDSLVCNLREMLPLDTNPVISLKDQLQVLYGGLRLLGTILVKEPNKFDEKMKDSIGVLICDAGLIIFSLYQKDIKIDIDLQDLLERIEHIQKQVEEKDPETSNFNNIKTDASKIITGKKQDIKMNKVTKKSSHVPTQSSAPKIDEVIGFDHESTSITDRLTRGSKQLRIIAIVGMPGQGKTTLATKVYRCNTVMYHFHVRALCSISQVFNRREVLLELLNHIFIELPERCFAMSEQDLAEELRRQLLGNRYLIFLDDVWDIQVWNSLAESLPDDYNGSRIILTSRLRDVAPRAMLDEEHHLLRQLTIDESWQLLERKLFHGKGCPTELYELGMQIADNCKGLPLTIVIVAGLLAIMKPENWNEILGSLSSGILSTTGQCMNTLELSYNHLPDYLKRCFLYFGMFPEGKEVSAKTLIRLWIAEEFIQETKLKSIEDVATDYLKDLIGRSLVFVAKRGSIGGTKACRVHDLLHEFCMTKAKEGNFSKQLRGYDELLAFNAPRNLQRLSIQSDPRHFMEVRLFCPGVRSLLFFTETEWSKQEPFDISFVINISKLLRVLDIGQIYRGSVPNEIGLLVQLRYLAVRGWINVIPSSIGNLSYLETFIVHSPWEIVSFPDTLWNLRKLRHLHVGIRSGVSKGFSYAIENLGDFSDLYQLESCSGAIIFSWGSMQKQMKKFANIRKLKCKLFENWDDTENCKRIVVPDFLSQLESLGLSQFAGYRKPVDFEFGLPAHLKKLTLSGFRLPWSKISSIGKLPNLEVLKLLDGSFSGATWDMGEGEFSRLRFLKLDELDIVKWTASDDQFPLMQKLVVHRCRLLKETPSCLENTLTLEMIEVFRCSHSLPSSVKQIQEEQMNMGNSDLKILILPWKK